MHRRAWRFYSAKLSLITFYAYTDRPGLSTGSRLIHWQCFIIKPTLVLKTCIKCFISIFFLLSCFPDLPLLVRLSETCPAFLGFQRSNSFSSTVKNLNCDITFKAFEAAKMLNRKEDLRYFISDLFSIVSGRSSRCYSHSLTAGIVPSICCFLSFTEFPPFFLFFFSRPPSAGLKALCLCPSHSFFILPFTHAWLQCCRSKIVNSKLN